MVCAFECHACPSFAQLKQPRILLLFSIPIALAALRHDCAHSVGRCEDSVVMWHAWQAMRFGNSLEACLKAIDLGFERAPAPCGKVYKAALKTLELVRSAICRACGAL